MRSSYLDHDVTILLKDITGLVEPQPAAEREKKIQSGVHYCEMLPLEYSPSAAYQTAYEAAFGNLCPTYCRGGCLTGRADFAEKKDAVWFWFPGSCWNSHRNFIKTVLAEKYKS